MRASRLVVGLVLLAASSCSGYQAQPLTDEAVAADLTGPFPPPPEVRQAVADRPPLRPVVLDLSDGLSPDEAALVAVAVNPELRALRDQRGVARAQVVQAGILPNPQLEGSLDVPTDGALADTVVGYGVGLSWDLSELAGRSARRSAAQYAAQAVDLDIAWQEWQVAQEARLHVYRLIAGAAELELADQAVAVWAAEEDRMRSGLARGVATSLDLASAESGRRDAELERLRLQQTQEEERLALNEVLGVAPDVAVPIDQTSPLPSWDPPPDAAALLDGLPRWRLDLRALALGYQSQDESVRAAIQSRFPAIGVGVNRARDTGDVGSVGFAVTLDLPFFDRHQGEVQTEEATRQSLYDEYLARVRSARAEVARIAADMDAVHTQIAASEEAIPIYRDASDRAEEAVATGHLNLVTAHELRRRALSAQLDLLDLRASLVELGLALEVAVGRLLSDEETPAPATGPAGPTPDE